jgi:predicted MFS family arabinose efflux permease
LNFFLADVQSGVGPFLAIYLAGALVDRLRSKRALIAAGMTALAAEALLIALAPAFWSVMRAEVLIGGASSIFGPAICAVSLGIVGRRLFDGRQGRSQTFNSAGNVVAVSMGLLGHFISNRSILFFVFVLALPTMLALVAVHPDRPLLVFLVRAVMFHRVAIQVLDGVAAALFGVVSVLVIADLTKGTGRFNLTVGIGASLSQVIAGSMVHRFGSNAGFLFLAAVAAAAFGILYFFMPETRDTRLPIPPQGAPTL